MSDYLSDEDAERMHRAGHPDFWKSIEECEASPDDKRRALGVFLRSDSIATMRSCWSARPESARKLDGVIARGLGSVLYDVIGVRRSELLNGDSKPQHYHCSAGCEKAQAELRCVQCGAAWVACTTDVCGGEKS